MKRLILISMLFLSSCAPYMVHSPSLVNQPTNKEKYSKDLDDCRHKIFSERGIDYGQSASIAGFGVLGMAAYGHPPAYDAVDSCIAAKGYAIKS